MLDLFLTKSNFCRIPEYFLKLNLKIEMLRFKGNTAVLLRLQNV